MGEIPFPILFYRTMVQFNTLKFIDERYLHINVSVIALPCYDNVYIEKILIDNEDTVRKDRTTDDGVVFSYTCGVDTKEVELIVDTQEYPDLAGAHMLFVYGKATGTPSSDTPCGGDNIYTLQAVVNLKLVYDKAVEFLNCSKGACGCAGLDCDINKELANFAIQYTRMKLGLECGDYENAFDAFKAIMHLKSSKSVPDRTKKCGCNG